jgi:hypothetical protein
MSPWLIGTPFAVVGIVLVGIGVHIFARDGAAKDWPTTDGVITSSKIDSNTIQTHDRAGNLRYAETRQPKVSYSYTVDGKQLEGSRITREPHADGHGDAKLAAYPVGKTVKVYYDPKDPASSVLELGTSIGGIIFAALGAFFVLFSIVLVVVLKFVVKPGS